MWRSTEVTVNENAQGPIGGPDVSHHGRRAILKWAGATIAAAGAFGVNLSTLGLTKAFAQAGEAVDLGSGDFGVLNYAYALEQLEAAFYTQAIATPYQSMSRYEHSVLSDIKGHEIAHREFFKKALGRNRIPDLTPNFSAVDFGDRSSVLKTASTFEDLGVSAYNGGGAAIQDAKYLAAAGSIVSVEARHAAILRDLLMPLTANFAGDDVVDSSGLDVASPPSKVLASAAPFIATRVTATQLP
jgi:Ferritin-like domain